MNSRQRVQLALAHQEPDHVPFDLGGTVLSSIQIQAYQRLRNLLGLGGQPEIMHVVQQIAVIADDLRALWGADVCNVASRDSSSFRLEKHESDGYIYFHDEWGAGWKMPKEGGLYFDLFDSPLAKIQSPADLERHAWPDATDPARYEGLRQRARHAAEVEGKAVFLDGLCAGIMEMSSWLRGFENFYSDLACNEKLATALMTRVMEIKMQYWDIALREAGEYADVLEEADDLGAQSRMIISPQTYRRLIKPLHKQLFDFIHARTKAKLFFHSCGAIRPIIPDLIEIGVEVLNPVQVSAAGMDSAELKREYGKDLAFWGGGVDTQSILPYGTPQQVREEVKRRIGDLAPGGGFVFAPVHNIQSDVPAENIVAMWEAWQTYGTYHT